MRWVALVLIALSLPVFIAWLSQGGKRRDQALMAIGAMVFLTGDLQIDAALITWPQWHGTAKGIVISPMDMLALALIATRGSGADNLPFRVLLALYSLPILLSLAFASVPMASSFVFVQLLQMIVLFVAIAGELGRPAALRSLLVGLSIGLMIQAGYVIQQKLTGVVQATGTMGHQNLLGMMVELAILPLIAAVLNGEKHKLIYTGIVAGLIVVAGGGSRGAMGIIGAGILLLTILELARRITPRKIKILGLGALALAVFVPLGLATLENRFGDSSLVTEEEQRAAFERAARAIAADYPFGVGANLYVPVANTQGYADNAGVAWIEANRSAPVHNAYLLARAETGWAGQVTLLALLLVPAIVGVRFAFANRRGRAEGIALGSAMAIVAIAIHSNYEFAWHVRQPQMLFFLNLAVIAGCMRAARIDRRARQRAMRMEAGARDHAPDAVPGPAGAAPRPG